MTINKDSQVVLNIEIISFIVGFVSLILFYDTWCHYENPVIVIVFIQTVGTVGLLIWFIVCCLWTAIYGIIVLRTIIPKRQIFGTILLASYFLVLAVLFVVIVIAVVVCNTVDMSIGIFYERVLDLILSLNAILLAIISFAVLVVVFLQKNTKCHFSKLALGLLIISCITNLIVLREITYAL